MVGLLSRALTTQSLSVQVCVGRALLFPATPLAGERVKAYNFEQVELLD